MKVLFIGAHYDDIELGCGGTILRHLEKGDDVIYIGFSDCNNDALGDECLNALQVLGITQHWFNDVHYRLFNEHRQFILDGLIALKKTYKPDLVYTHSQHDRHQDHAVVGQESLRAFRNSTILTYTSAHNRISHIDNYFVGLSEAQIDKKIEALKCYKSQSANKYMSEDSIYYTAMVAGGIVGVDLAESFYTERIIV